MARLLLLLLLPIGCLLRASIITTRRLTVSSICLPIGLRRLLSWVRIPLLLLPLTIRRCGPSTAVIALLLLLLLVSRCSLYMHGTGA